MLADAFLQIYIVVISSLFYINHFDRADYASLRRLRWQVILVHVFHTKRRRDLEHFLVLVFFLINLIEKLDVRVFNTISDVYSSGSLGSMSVFHHRQQIVHVVPHNFPSSHANLLIHILLCFSKLLGFLKLLCTIHFHENPLQYIVKTLYAETLHVYCWLFDNR